jgi:site-specific DNA-adenine methylase
MAGSGLTLTAPRYGSKSRLAPKIAALTADIPLRVYIEPSADSAAVLFRKPRASVENADALDLIRKHAGPGSLVYADPPYLAETRTGQARSRQGNYRHELADDSHRALARVLRSTAAAVLVSGYDHPLCEQLYDGWHRTEIRVTKPSANHSAAAARHAEVIWSNRPDRRRCRAIPARRARRP